MDPASKKLFLTRVWFGGDRTRCGSRFELSGEIIALWRDTEQSKVTLQWEHAKSLLSMHCNVSMGIERKFFLDAYK